jgi:hypothetical protein
MITAFRMMRVTRFSNLSLAVMIVIAGAQCVPAQSAAPTLLTEENAPGAAAALDSVTRVRSPLPVVAQNNFSGDHRTRLALFAANAALNAGETASAVTATARDSRGKVHHLGVEFVGQVPNQTWMTQVVVRLPDSLANAGAVWISITLHGQTSNEVLFNIATQIEPRTVTLPARRIINGVDNYTVSAFSFEFGVNGDAALRLTRNDWDIQFGNRPDRDTFNVTMVVDDCSRIRDLGALNWTDNFQVPIVAAYPVPTIEPDVDAIVGHMYVVHTKDSDTDLYALFRVEVLEPLKSVTITWKSVQSPEDP